MSKIIEAEIPGNSLSAIYAKEGAFVDCYYIDIPGKVTLENYIKAFYTTSLFKVERTILSIATFSLAYDSEAIELSLGNSENYSIWTVEDRSTNQIILHDFTKKTRSWLMIQNPEASQGRITRLFFGSVVVPKEVSENGEAKFGFLFHAFARFHQVYSKGLLNAAYKKLLKGNNSTYN